ncbi:hypothetical protein [Methylocucumis oryzae]|uniref:Uncharacterized protein n=1 Tax=Methylocucumis oryzae TaxID=1632867 RepID=A0A0F3IJY9_9GAMM|nr:hypothetical protein [Methylocucumis oryzae]KJV06843.1 hypothetical protein VZ94_08685 [Methylocucumis oryzae]
MKLKAIVLPILTAFTGWLFAGIYPPEYLNPSFKQMVWFKNDVVISPEQSEFFGKIARGSKCKQIWAKGFYRSLSCTFIVESESITESKVAN